MRLESEEENIRELAPTGIRIPSALKEAIKEAARKNSRSMNAEIVACLQQGFGGGGATDRAKWVVEDDRDNIKSSDSSKLKSKSAFIERRPMEVQQTLVYLYNKVMHLRSGEENSKSKIEIQYLEKEILENEAEYKKLMEIINK